MTIQDINRHIGNIDIYLLDQILKGRYHSDMKVLDAGCGEGRNIMCFLNEGYDTYGVDNNPDAIRMLQFIVGANYPNISKDNFTISAVEKMPYAEHQFDLIISSAVLHFAQDRDHFNNMFSEMMRVLKPGGQLFIRMTSDIGLDISSFERKDDLHVLGDESLRFLITKQMLLDLLNTYHLELVEPIKSTNVEDLRSMGTFVLRKKLEV